MPPLVELCAAGRRSAETRDWLLHDVSLELGQGQRLALSGPSGSGKTVLLRALAALDTLQTGTLRWRGSRLHAKDIPGYRAQVTYLAQRPALLEGTVEANLKAPFALAAHCAQRYDAARVEAWLKQLGRSPTFLGKHHQNLSGGEAQLVAVIRALQLDPTVLLLDEPTASLDAATASQVEAVVAGWLSEYADRAAIWASHDPELAARFGASALHLAHGRIEAD